MNYEAQLTLISDILKNQQAQSFGTEDEFDQISRLTEALRQNDQVSDEAQQVLANIADYCQSKDCLQYTNDIYQWIETIDTITTTN